VFNKKSAAGRAYLDAVARFVGEQPEMRFVQPERNSIFRTLFGRA
jgi:septum site-determining protein MinD